MAALLKSFCSAGTSSYSAFCSLLSLGHVSKRGFRPRWVAPTLRTLKSRKDIEDEKNGGPKIFHRSTFLEWNYDAELFAFANRLGEKFDDALLRCALTHRSYSDRESSKLLALGMENGLSIVENDELASKGEKFMSAVVKGYLRAVFTKVPEEFIGSVHDQLMSVSTLSHVGKNIGLGDITLCADFPCHEETLAKSLKAIVAALEQSSGEERARIFVQDMIVTQLYGKDVNEIWNPVNPVGILADILAREGKAEPEFRLIRQAGHGTILAAYHVGVYSDKMLIASGAGESIETAQEMAARDGLKRLFHTEDCMKALPFGRQLANIQKRIIESEKRANVSLNEWTSSKATLSN